MISIATLLIVLTLSILITRIATVALTHTGLPRESAKFQARSAFTGVGFTTSESEKVVSHPLRRRILLLLMLLGNAGIVTAVSSLIVSFVNINRSKILMWQMLREREHESTIDEQEKVKEAERQEDMETQKHETDAKEPS